MAAWCWAIFSKCDIFGPLMRPIFFSGMPVFRKNEKIPLTVPVNSTIIFKIMDNYS